VPRTVSKYPKAQSVSGGDGEMSEEERQAVLRRLRRVEGQIRGLQRMIEERRSCEEIVVQATAARAALDKAALLVLRRHLEECLRQSDPSRRDESLEKALDLLFKLKS